MTGVAASGAGRFELRPQDPQAARELGRAAGVDASIAQVLLHRGIADVGAATAFLSPKLSDLTAPDAMADRKVAAERLARAVRAHERVVLFGDYDVDGTTSTAILAGILEELGGDVTALVANRFEGGYGLSEAALDRVLGTGATLLVTCDCGSSDHERVARARARGLDVIVVDHHLVPAEPLPVLAFLNPHRPECGFSYKGLSSAGLALSLGAAVRAELGAKLDVRRYLDLVALGTIADMVPLDGDNRRLVRAGLALLAAPVARPGIVVLRELGKLKPGDALSAVDVAFRMTPRLNAAGRLGDPSVTLALLRARTAAEARGLGAAIERLNDERKRIERDVTASAMEQAREVYGEAPEHGIVVAARGWHRGVVGITAAKLVERFGVPTVVVALDDGGMGHASCRAPEGSRLYDAVASCASELESFGGHQAAAGLVVREARVEALRAAFSDTTRGKGGGTGPRARVADVVLDGTTFGLPPARDLALLEPVGEGNAEPLWLVTGARVAQSGVVGEGHLKMQLRVGRQTLSAFGWLLGARAPGLDTTVDVLGQLRPDTWRGGQAVELRVVAL